MANICSLARKNFRLSEFCDCRDSDGRHGQSMPNSPAMTVIDEQGRPEPPLASSERDTLLGFLDYQRATLEWKTRGLDAAGLNATLAPSTMTLGGLLKHMAIVEEYWFGERLIGADDIYATIDWAADPDWDWHSAAEDSPETLRRMWQDNVTRARARVKGALEGEGLDTLAKVAQRDGSALSLRWILLHMIEEYARHNGHADLLRESVDGQTGE